MSILIIQHHPAWLPGVILDEAQATGERVQSVNLPDGDLPPRDLTGVRALVLLGGPFQAVQADEFPWMRQELKLIDEAYAGGIPVLGIGLGAHLLAIALGGGSKPLIHNDQLWLEAGWAGVRLDSEAIQSGLFQSFPAVFEAFTFHLDELVPPPGARHFGTTSVCPCQAFQFEQKYVGIQPHLEITKDGIAAIIADQRELIARAGVSPVHMQMDMLLRLQQLELYSSLLFSRFFDLTAQD